MPTTIDVSAGGGPRNALLLAEACSLAYFDEPESARGFRETLGLEARLISVDNTQVYVAENADVVLVAFRGSECPTSLDGLKDWLLTNANNYLILPEGRFGTEFAAAGVGARFHRGFMEALGAVWTPLHTAVDQAIQKRERPLWITGHSLGGALALLAAWRFQRNFLDVDRIVTFGAPMVGNQGAADAFEKAFAGKIARYVNLEDPVPLLPSVSLLANLYVHCPTEVGLSVAGAASSALDALRASAGAAAESFWNASVLEDVWAAVEGRISSHFITHYLERVKARIAEQAGDEAAKPS